MVILKLRNRFFFFFFLPHSFKFTFDLFSDSLVESFYIGFHFIIVLSFGFLVCGASLILWVSFGNILGVGAQGH